MRIAELLTRGTAFVSLEFFPPRDRALWPAFFAAAERLREVNPLFVSVTYGAMGSTRDNTMEIVARLKNECGMETMAHLTCIGASAASVDEFLDALVRGGVDNVLALRGDPPAPPERERWRAGPPARPPAAPGEAGGERERQQGDVPEGGPACLPGEDGDLRCATDLVSLIRSRHPSLGIGVAAYPEGHPEAPSAEEDLRFLKRKLDLGADFAITQLFFDNAVYFDFVRRAREAGVSKPLLPGILPVLSLGTIDRLVSKCGARIPADYLGRLRDADRRGGTPAVAAEGIAHAKAQARGLIEGGAPGVHLYTLNRAEACLEIVRGLRPGNNRGGKR